MITPEKMSEIDRHVGGQIRRRRKSAGLSQDALGRGVGVSFQQIQKYEIGTNRVSASMMYAICGVIGCQPKDLFPEMGPEGPRTDHPVLMVDGAEELLRAYGELSKTQRRATLSLVRAMQPG